MELKFALNSDDYLQHQLYSVNKNPRIVKKRKRAWLMITLTFAIISLFSFVKPDFFTIGSGVFAVISLFFYPIYERNQYKKHYKKHVNEVYKNRFGIESSLSFNEKNIESISEIGESNFNYSAFESFVEISNYYFLFLKTGGAIIIPKTVTSTIIDFKEQLNLLSVKNNISFEEDLNWKWK